MILLFQIGLSDEPLVDLPPPLPPKMIDFDEDMESPPQQGELETEETPPPLPPPYKETSLKKMLVDNGRIDGV